MCDFLKVVFCAVLLICGEAYAGHVSKGKETNVVMLYCVLDTSKQPTAIVVEAVSVNLTRHPLPSIRPGAPCSQGLHEYLTAGFEILNHETATTVFVLTREDMAIVHH